MTIKCVKIVLVKIALKMIGFLADVIQKIVENIYFNVFIWTRLLKSSAFKMFKLFCKYITFLSCWKLWNDFLQWNVFEKFIGTLVLTEDYWTLSHLVDGFLSTYL